MVGRRLVTLGLVVALGSSGSSAADAGGRRFESGRLRWSELGFRASKLTVTATSEVRLSHEPVRRASEEWLEPQEGRPVSPSGAAVMRVQLRSEILGKRSELDLWLDPDSAAAIQRTQLETGRKVRHHRHRALRFTETGVFNVTHRATDETVDRPWREWAPSEVFESYPSDVGEDATVTEPSALFYLLAVADLERVGDSLTTLVFSKGRLMRVRMSVVDRAGIKADYIEVSDSGETRIRGRRETLRIAVEGTSVAPGASERGFEFLGLRGDVEIFLEPARRLPLQIAGDLRYAGRGRVRLQRVVLN